MTDPQRAALLETIRGAIIGSHHEIEGPFGSHLVTYADYTASGRSLRFVEDFIRAHVLPYYANTHSESSATGLQTSAFREDARRIIADAVGATDDDVLIFAGSGATGAIGKLIDILNLRLPADLAERYALLDRIPERERPVVFIGPYEHHSNELPWRESIADVVVIDEDEDGHPDPALLREQLEIHADRPLKIGSFSAASNVTGIRTDVRGLSRLLHRHGALALWDYAAAGPYVAIDVAPSPEDPHGYLDAVFLSPHKFIGGPGTPGVLVVKKRLLVNRVPSVPGGGTVAYVTPTEHRYIDDPAHREEGGTPEIIGAIRAGLAFQLKQAVGADLIERREHRLTRRAIDHWDRDERIRILGNRDALRLSIVSFMVRHRDRYLHHNFVTSLLNDLFGIQARGGCSCAGPYGHRLLGIDLVLSEEYRREVLRGCEGIKPGWTRINFNYFITEPAFAFILAAVDFVVEHGWRFLPLYRFSPTTGLWDHAGWEHRAAMRLTDIRYDSGTPRLDHPHRTTDESAYANYLQRARELAATLPAAAPPPPDEASCVNANFDGLRWFPLPHEGLNDHSKANAD